MGQGTVNQPDKPPRAPGRPRMSDAERVASEERRRNLNLTLGRERTATANSIGKIPKCKNPKRRAAAEKSLRGWIETYLSRFFVDPQTGIHSPWSNTMTEAMGVAERVVVAGLRSIFIFARGGFKTSLCKAAALFSILRGDQQWVCIVAATDDKAQSILEDLKLILMSNKLLAEDYPEACWPIINLKNQSNRAARQTYKFNRAEHPTHIEWSADRIVLADIQGSKCRQGIFTALGLTSSALLGQAKAAGDGTNRRPTCVLFDDCETKESARSLIQTSERLSLVASGLQMAGPMTSIAAFYTGTVLVEGCVCDRLADSPGWDSIRRPSLIKFPLHCDQTSPDVEHGNLWGDYAELLTIKPTEKAREKCNEFYGQHRAKAECLPILDQPRPCDTCELRPTCMDANVIVDWIHRKKKHELSAAQSAMNMYFLEPEVFWCEFQQSPRKKKEEGFRVSPAQIMHRVNGYAISEAPRETEIITCGIDVQKELLYYVICAWQPNFTGAIIEYGTWPDQGGKPFSKQNPPHPAWIDHRGFDGDGVILEGISSLLIHLKNRKFTLVGGSAEPERIKSCFVDGRGTWGPKLAFAGVKRSDWPGAEVCMGVGNRPQGKKPVEQWDPKKPVDGNKWQKGFNWFKIFKGSRADSHTSILVNQWKTFIHRGLSLPIGTPGAITLFGSDREAYQHEHFAHHIGGSEYPKQLPPDDYGNEFTQWMPVLGEPDNDWLDALVYATCAASASGKCHPPAFPKQAPKEPIRRIVRPSPVSRHHDSIYS